MTSKSRSPITGREDAERGPGKTEAETGVRQPHAKQHLEPPQAGRGKEGCSLGPSEGAWTQGGCEEAAAVLQVSDGGGHARVVVRGQIQVCFTDRADGMCSRIGCGEREEGSMM